MTRHAAVQRETSETKITLSLNLDDPVAVLSDGPVGIDTGVGFFDHMLTAVAKHGRLALAVRCHGDTHIDDHHTVEDVGLVLGQALGQALGDKRGIERYGSANVPMDETLARCDLDLSGRPALVFRVPWVGYGIDPPAIAGERIGKFDVQLVEEFFRAVSNEAKMNLHLEVPWGTNNHHIAEALFKSFARALRAAVAVTHGDIPSTKGSL
ncbi:MAG: imidazoleglycerol-phosphate dehydratase HisB [Planctomycetota bacterium]